MWPFTSMSLSAATLIGSIANWTLLVCLLGGVLATFVIVQTTDVKEEHWADDRKHSNERIAELSTQSEQLRKETAEANARALEAQAQLAKYRARRTMWSDAGSPSGLAKMDAVSDRLRASFSGMKWDAASVPYDPESTLLLREIQHLLARSAWQQADWPGQGTRDWPEAKTVGLYGGAGLVVTITSIEKSPKAVVDAANELAKALHELGISPDQSIVQMPDISSADAVHVLVGKKRM